MNATKHATTPWYMRHDGHTGGWVIERLDRATGDFIVHGVYGSSDAALAALGALVAKS